VHLVFGPSQALLGGTHRQFHLRRVRTGLRQDCPKLSHPGLSSMIFSKPTKNYGKPPFLMDKSTISTGICLKLSAVHLVSIY
jgi:hypothetical protein